MPDKLGILDYEKMFDEIMKEEKLSEPYSWEDIPTEEQIVMRKLSNILLKKRLEQLGFSDIHVNHCYISTDCEYMLDYYWEVTEGNYMLYCKFAEYAGFESVSYRAFDSKLEAYTKVLDDIEDYPDEYELAERVDALDEDQKNALMKLAEEEFESQFPDIPGKKLLVRTAASNIMADSVSELEITNFFSESLGSIYLSPKNPYEELIKRIIDEADLSPTGFHVFDYEVLGVINSEDNKRASVVTSMTEFFCQDTGEEMSSNFTPGYKVALMALLAALVKKSGSEITDYLTQNAC